MNTKRILYFVFTAILAALVVVLQVAGGIPAGPFSITLTLFPLVVGAVVLGPVSGLFLGLVFGVIVSILSITGKDPGGYMVFAANPVMAWIVCLLKGAAAGFVPAVAYRFFSRHKNASAAVSYMTAGIFIFLGGVGVTNSLSGARIGVRIGLTALFALAAGGLLAGLHYLLKTERSSFYISSILAPICNTGIFILFMLLFFRPTLSAWAGGSNLLVFAITGLVGVNFLIEFSVAIILTPALMAIARYAGKRFPGPAIRKDQAPDAEKSKPAVRRGTVNPALAWSLIAGELVVIAIICIIVML